MHNGGMIYSCSRVSTDTQDPNNQVARLKAARGEIWESRQVPDVRLYPLKRALITI